MTALFLYVPDESVQKMRFQAKTYFEEILSYSQLYFYRYGLPMGDARFVKGAPRENMLFQFCTAMETGSGCPCEISFQHLLLKKSFKIGEKYTARKMANTHC